MIPSMKLIYSKYFQQKKKPEELNRHIALIVLFGFGFVGTAQAQGVTVGIYSADTGTGCSTLVLKSAGPAGNSYIYDKDCNGSVDYTAKSVRVTSRGISVDQARMTKIVTNTKGFTGDWKLGGQTIKGLAFIRK